MTNPVLFKLFNIIALLMDLAVILLGATVIGAWYFKVPAVFDILGSISDMKVNAALCLILSAASLALTLFNKVFAARITAILSLLISFMTCIEYVFNVNSGIDQLIIQDWSSQVNLLFPGRMSLSTAFSLLFLNCALLVFSLKKKLDDIIMLLTFPTLMISSFAFFTTAKGGEFFLLLSHPMAIQTAICLFFLVVAIYLSGPVTGQFLAVINNRASGFVTRLLLPSSFIVPPLVVILSLWGQNRGLYDISFQQGVVVMLGTGICFLFSWVLIDILHSMDFREEQANTLLRASNKELEAFSYSISHDLRSPLRSITNFSEFLFDHAVDQLDDKSKDYLLRIQNAAKRMDQLIEGILLLSKIGRTGLKTELVNLSRIAEMIIDELKQSQPEREVTVRIQPAVFAKGDKGLLMVLIQNLLNNSWKYTKKTEHPTIEFGMIQQENQIIYFVSDNGVGFDSKHAEKLFTPFLRLHSAQEFEGSGIGLATVERIINRHHGKIWAESEVNKGATFYFCLNLFDRT